MEKAVVIGRDDKEILVKKVIGDEVNMIECPQCGEELTVSDVSYVGPCGIGGGILLYQCECGFYCEREDIEE